MKVRICLTRIDFDWIGSILKIKNLSDENIMNKVLGSMVNAVTPERLVLNYLKLNPEFLTNQCRKRINENGLRIQIGSVRFVKDEDLYYLYAEVFWVDWESVFDCICTKLEANPYPQATLALVTLRTMGQSLGELLQKEEICQRLLRALIQKQDELVATLQPLLYVENRSIAQLERIDAIFDS